MTPTRARVITEPLGGSPLSLAAQERRLPPALQPTTPSGPQGWREHAARRGAASPGWHESIAPALAASGTAAERLESVVAGGGVVVTTGQQAAILGGPQYTLAKALSARALADRIQRDTGIPTAPVFWAATDDTDFLEASVTWVADVDGLHELRLDEAPPAGTTLAATPLRKGDARRLLETVRRACGSSPGADVLDRVHQAFGGDSTIGRAYVTLMRGLLEPLGIAVLDSSHPAYRAAADVVLREALTRAPEIAAALAENTRALRAAGHEPQVVDDRGLSLVFEVADGVRRRITLDEAAAATRTARALAPNVLLRPIVERELLPTVAYVGGPGEIAYFTQSNAAAAALGREPLVVVPRWSGTVIEPFVDRALRRLGARWQDVKDLHGLERRLALAAMPADVAASWKRLREQVQAALQDFGMVVAPHGLLDPAVVEGLERSIGHRLARGERRLLASVKRRNAQVRRDLTTASAALFPLGSRQERVLNFVPMLAREGATLVEAMLAAAGDHAADAIGVAHGDAVAASR